MTFNLPKKNLCRSEIIVKTVCFTNRVCIDQKENNKQSSSVKPQIYFANTLLIQIIIYGLQSGNLCLKFNSPLRSIIIFKTICLTNRVCNRRFERRLYVLLDTFLMLKHGIRKLMSSQLSLSRWYVSLIVPELIRYMLISSKAVKLIFDTKYCANHRHCTTREQMNTGNPLEGDYYGYCQVIAYALTQCCPDGQVCVCVCYKERKFIFAKIQTI